jgi:hypothetical protein
MGGVSVSLITMRKLKTEHAGAKKGRGAFYGKKAIAKLTSNRSRRRNDVKSVEEGYCAG